MMANKKINLYSGKEYLFTLETDKNGKILIDSIEPNTYKWTCNSLYSGGSIDIDADSKDATIRMTINYWFTPLIEFWYQHMVLICMLLLIYLVLCITVPILFKRIYMRIQKKKNIIFKEPKPIQKTEVNSETECIYIAEDINLRDAGLICPSCGLQAEAGARYCKRCGCDLSSGIRNILSD